MILYTYSLEEFDEDRRWKDDGIRDWFFEDLDEARRVVLELRKHVLSEEDAAWRPVYLERVEIAPVGPQNILALLNDGVGTLVRCYDVIEVIT
jgi:hypothetical protein